MKPKHKDLLVFAARTEAHVTALRIAIEDLDPEHVDLCTRVLALQHSIAAIRKIINEMGV